MDITLGSFATVVKDGTVVSGQIDGIKVNELGLERISIVGIDYWFYLDLGWQFVEVVDEEEDEDGEI